MTAVQNRKDECVPGESIQTRGGHRPELCLFSYDTGLPLALGPNQTHPEPCLGAERLPAHSGGPALQSQLLVPQKDRKSVV